MLKIKILALSLNYLISTILKHTAVFFNNLKHSVTVLNVYSKAGTVSGRLPQVSTLLHKSHLYKKKSLQATSTPNTKLNLKPL